MSEIFISYGRLDKPFIQILRDMFVEAGLSTWYDEDIAGGKEWLKIIVDEIRKCRVMVVVLSHNSVESQFVNLECGIAFGLNKIIIPLSIESTIVIPKDLAHLHVATYKDESTIRSIIDQIAQRHLTSRFWDQLFEAGIDICIPLIKYGTTEAVSYRPLTAGLELQLRLCQTFDPFLQNSDALRLVLTRDWGRELDHDRHWLLLGGPGGFPYVQNLLIEWFGNTETLSNGYRYFTEPGRFVNTLHVRDSEDGRIGIEDIRNGQRHHFYEMHEATREVNGTNYGVIYTKGFGDDDLQENKVIILAPFNRAVLDATIDFLMNDKRRTSWLQGVRKCGLCSETLVYFSFNTGRPPTYEGFETPRQLGIQSTI